MIITTIIIFIAVLSLLVFVHELGHFCVARYFGVRANEFGFGFPPRAFGFYKNKAGKWRKVVGKTTYEDLEKSEDESLHPAPLATIYSINWLPIGGFVSIKGENDNGNTEPDSFGAKKIWQRITILVAGVTMNVVLAWFLFSVGYMFGLPQTTTDLSPRARVSEASVAIIEVMPDSPASQAGLQAGDLILRINGQEVGLESDVQNIIGNSGEEPAQLLLKRGENEELITVKPEINGEGRGVMGVSIMAAGTVSYPFFSAIGEGAKLTGLMLKEIFVAFGDLIVNLFSGNKITAEFAGPVGIANITGQAARLGFVYLLQFIALLSLNLAVINILPFPALDGGRIFFLVIEKIKGKPVRRDFEAIANNIGFLFLIALVLFVTYKDIMKLF
ncbi:MAG: regulator of sigma protease [Patescibacteria group bacterium]|nr:regulator of sigma protease [Patescibacteria group bacterium]